MDNTAPKTKIDSLRLVEDLVYLCHMKKWELRSYKKYEWHPEVRKIFEKRLSGKYIFPYTLEPDLGVGYEMLYRLDYRLPLIYYIYKTDFIDDPAAYTQIYLEHLLRDRKWLNLIRITLAILRDNTEWGGDISEGPFITVLAESKPSVSPFVIYVMQNKNGIHYVISRQKLEHLNEYLVSSHED